MNIKVLLFLVGFVFISSCSSPTPTNPSEIPTDEEQLEETVVPKTEISPSGGADVIGVEMSRGENAFTFKVTISSPDEGCNRYADWWEVISQDGELLYRRILLHSHVGEQPFTRSGGPVSIDPDTIVLVRAHMHPDGFGGNAMQGSMVRGFEQVDLDPNFALELEEAPPLPDGCDF